LELAVEKGKIPWNLEPIYATKSSTCKWSVVEKMMDELQAPFLTTEDRIQITEWMKLRHVTSPLIVRNTSGIIEDYTTHPNDPELMKVFEEVVEHQVKLGWVSRLTPEQAVSPDYVTVICNNFLL
jgi:hypothetical protein